MIEIHEAFKCIHDQVKALPSVTLSLIDALGHTLAEDVISKIDMPPFDQSAMDGYAVHWVETQNEYELVGEVAAGADGSSMHLEPGQAVRIFTGAMVPDTANVVVKQEIVASDGKRISFTDSFQVGGNIRKQGEQINVGDAACKAGTILSPGTIGFLAGLGVTHVKAHRKPKVGIIVTGNELVPSNEELTAGKIYESNSVMIHSALKNYGYDCVSIKTVADNYEATRDLISQELLSVDVLLLSGGVSVGDYDFVAQALEEIGTTCHFHKVKQKPGKPVYFGQNEEKFVVGLPGNPGSALSIFYIYVLQVLDLLSGVEAAGLATINLPLAHDFAGKGTRSQFLKACFNDQEVAISGYQSSAMLRSFGDSNALVFLDAEKLDLKAGELVKVYIL